MAWPLPDQAQAVDRAADGPVGDGDRMMVAHIATQQGGGPDGGLIAERPGVAVDHRGDPFVDGATGDAGPTATRGVAEVPLGSSLKPAQPVVDGLAADLEQFGDFGDLPPLGQPEQRLGPASLLDPGGVRDEVFQFGALPVTERERGHRFTPRRTWGLESHSTRQRTSVTGGEYFRALMRRGEKTRRERGRFSIKACL